MKTKSPTGLNGDNIHHAPSRKLNILLSNGRFPVSLDLARQLRKGGHHVFTVDPMQYHVCKFSIDVKKSWQTPAPSRDPAGYVDAVKRVIRKANIDMIIPIHEEIFYLAESYDKEITERLFAPSFSTLYELHNKWEFHRTLNRCRLDTADTHLCTTRGDIDRLDRSLEWALKPALGRASAGVHHLRPGQEFDAGTIDLSPERPYLAQEWVKGRRYCTYGVVRDGHMQAFGIYPVLETIDGSSSVYFEAVEHEGIKEYVTTLASELQFTGQMALDFVEEGLDEDELHGSPRALYHHVGQRLRGLKQPSDEEDRNGNLGSPSKAPRRLVAIECNPRATSGIHLWSGTPKLALAFQDTDRKLPELSAKPGFARQTAPGMLMWERKRTSAWRYFQHLNRLLRTRDVIWSLKDFGPVLLQPFLLASYYRICHNMGGISLAEMFQSDLIWDPSSSKQLQDRVG